MSTIVGMKQLMYKFLLQTFKGRSIEDQVRFELDQALRDQLRYASVIETYAAAQNSTDARIARLRKYLQELDSDYEQDTGKAPAKVQNLGRIQVAN